MDSRDLAEVDKLPKPEFTDFTNFYLWNVFPSFIEQTGKGHIKKKKKKNLV